VVVADDKPAVHRVLPLSVTFDHRAVTGGEAGRFVAAMIADLQKAD
jgi:pyruvate dehydrogenase E2 component (dihydrolipoamide acetyltransferase)